MKTKTSVGTLVINHYQELRGFSSHIELKAWAERQNLKTAILFSQFKRRLFDIGIDYDALKYRQPHNIDNDTISHELTLYCSANTSLDKFAITNHLGQVLWYGRFFEQESKSNLDLSAANKSLWFASKIKEANGHIQKLRVNLYLDALMPRFSYDLLSKLALKYNLILNMTYIEKEKNLASRWASEMGFKKWSDNNFYELAEPVLQNETA